MDEDFTMTLDLLIVHGSDALQWSKFILQHLTQSTCDINARSLLDIDLFRLIETQTNPLALTYIVILSPEHLHFLLEHAQFSYSDMVSTLGIIYFTYSFEYLNN